MGKTRIFLIFMFLLIIGGLVYFQYQKTSNPGYERGAVMVSFKEGTTYKAAKDTLLSLGLSIENTNDYWKSMKFTPQDSTTLTKLDLFKIKVPVGSEDKTINQLEKLPTVRLVFKNSYLHITD